MDQNARIIITQIMLALPEGSHWKVRAVVPLMAAKWTAAAHVNRYLFCPEAPEK